MNVSKIFLFNIGFLTGIVYTLNQENVHAVLTNLSNTPINTYRREIFLFSTASLWPTQPPVQWVPRCKVAGA
jgi:hypothetical protein